MSNTQMQIPESKELAPKEAHDRKHSMRRILLGGMCVCLGILGGYISTLFDVKPLKVPFVTISVARVIESQAQRIDNEMIQNNTVLTDKEVQDRVERYTRTLSKVLEAYSKKHHVIVFEKGAIVSDGMGIEDITDAFIKAINE